MTMSRRRRRRTDRLVAALIAIVVVVLGTTVYLTSDIRATTSKVGAEQAAPQPMLSPPAALQQRWEATTDPRYGAVASPYGVVVTATEHGATGRDAVTGAARWSYTRSNTTLCAVGSGATDAFSGVGVTDVLTVFAKNGYCSQVMALDPVTGARQYARTSPNPAGGALVFGGPYAGWASPNLIELWGSTLLRTIQYGDQPNPTKPGTRRLGCTFTDIAVATTQFATIEHCPAEGSNARAVLNWTDPGANSQAKENGWDTFNHPVRADVDTGSPQAVLVGVTADRVAVLVAAPQPAVVVYDAAGALISRTPVSIPAAVIDEAAEHGPAPVVRSGSNRYTLIGSYLVATAVSVVTAPAATAASLPGTAPTGTAAATPAPAPAPAQVDSPGLAWVLPDALGLPAVVGSQLLMPVRGALQVVTAATGASAGSIPVDRGGYTGRVDAAAVGSMIIETRGATVVGMSAAGP